ncbi:hypothetical protein yc1106_00554 [Curvularia clavata]|uniref:Uncharacterized protein n=1 Tax=Curvularia clavata TaxID=95742 RepID=A0A9Q8Z1A7_CURCL|nr:hypothetical protein yc1106_00554 [Curvularia clavata]
MADAPHQVAQRIRDYAQEARHLLDDGVDFDASDTEARLAQTVKELQARVEEQQAALDQLRSRSNLDLESVAYASEHPRQKLQQLVAVKDAYTSLKPTATYLPGPTSLLPALLAARSLQQNVHGTKEAIASTQSQLDAKETILRREQGNLHDANSLTGAMQDRIERLRSQHQDRSQKTAAQLARELIAAKRMQEEYYDSEMQRLGEAMNDFINDYLSTMLAAEELGGPVVGDMLDVDDDTLAAGFTKKGRAKSSKKAPSDKIRQRRIDQIWGNSNKAVANQDDDDNADEEQPPPTEAEAADAEMRQLIGNLFATLMGPGRGKAYFQLQRDSAASRFLVRAKIAQFHPRDANKLRLVDFGRELDD